MTNSYTIQFIDFNEVYKTFDIGDLPKLAESFDFMFKFLANPKYFDVTIVPTIKDCGFGAFNDIYSILGFFDRFQYITPLHVEFYTTLYRCNQTKNFEDLGLLSFPRVDDAGEVGEPGILDYVDSESLNLAYQSITDWFLEKMRNYHDDFMVHAPAQSSIPVDSPTHEENRSAFAAADASKKSLQLFRDEQGPTETDVRVFLRQTIDSMNTLENIYGYANSLIGDKGEASDEAKTMLKMIFFMNPVARGLLLAVIPKSGMITACGPADVVEGADEDAKEATIASWEPPSAEILEGVKSLVGAPPFVNSAAKQFVSPQDSRRHRLSIHFSDPTATGPGGYLLNDRYVPYAHKHHLISRYNLEVNCYDNALSNIEKYKINESLVEFKVNNMYTDTIDMPNSLPVLYSRFTMKFNLNKESPSLCPEINSVKIYSMRAEEKKVSEFQDTMKTASVSNISTYAFGAERLGVYSVINNTKAGKKMLDRFEKEARLTVKDANPMYFNDYLEGVIASCQLIAEPTQRAENLARHRKLVEKFANPSVVDKFWAEQFQTKILPCLASHQGFRYNLQGELSIGGVGVLALAKLANCFDGTKVPVGQYPSFVLCAHTLASSLGFSMTFTDGYSGQNLNGELVAVDVTGDGTANRTERISIDYKTSVESLHYRTASVARTEKAQKFISTLPGVSILIDLFIPGLLYNPQNASNRLLGIKYIGKKLLYDAPLTSGLYAPEYLAKLNGFVVYVNASQCSETTSAAVKKAYNNLFRTHAVYLAPTSILHYHGMYMVGARRDLMLKDGKGEGYVTSFSLFRYYLLTNVTLKTRALLEHYSRLPTDPVGIIASNTKAIYSLGYLRTLGKTVGGRDAYKELLTKKDALKPIEAVAMDEYFDDSSKIAIAWKSIDDGDEDPLDN